MAKSFEIEQLNQDKFIKQNDLQQITNPVMFATGNGPTSDGLLSNEIFGITKEERSGIFAYLDLGEYFINPYFYKIWLKIDKSLRSIIYETDTFIVDKNGYLVKDENGETGIEFLHKNVSKIKFKDSKKQSMINALMQNKDNMFSDKFVIIPPFYRDVNTSGNGGKMGVGEINKLYVNLMNNIRALKDSNEYGLTMIGGIRGRIQDIMLEIYNWFTIGETIVGGPHTGAGIFKKFGIQHTSTMSKTTDNSARLVLSSQKINVESIKDLMVDFDYSSIPLAATCVIAYPFMIYQLRQFFNNEFGGKVNYSYINKQGQLDSVELSNPQIEFSDFRFDKEINEFIHGYSNRFKPISIPNVEGKDIRLRFKGYSVSKEQYESGVRESNEVIERDLTWMDILYITACEATEDKQILITRYPVEFAASL